MRRVAIIHPWFPEYRARFFLLLKQYSADMEIDLKIFYGATPPEWIARNDSTSGDYAVELPSRFFRIGGRHLIRKSLRPLGDLKAYDLVIVEQAVRNIETYELLMRGIPLAFWGHGRTYTAKAGVVQEAVKNGLTNRGRWFFSYTDGGRQAVASHGFPPSRISVVRNAPDTESLLSDLRAVSSSDVHSFKRLHGLGDITALYMGGLDRSKRIDFVIQASMRVRELIPGFQLLVAGDGDEGASVRAVARSVDWIHVLGRVAGREKALALRASEIIVNPGRVGLVAVDSLVSGCPIVTTRWPYHAPEFEYLEDGVTAWVTADNEEEYARVVVDILENGAERSRVASNARSVGADLTADRMARRFVAGISRALDDSQVG